jgi:transcriptional regulator with XRE-family HTH domain
MITICYIIYISLFIYIYISFALKSDMLYYINMRDNTKKHIMQRPLRLKGLPVDLREKLKEARISRGWGQRELGGKIGLPQPHISAIESGDVVPRFDTLLDVVRVLELDLLLVPRSLVPAVQSLIRAQKDPESAEKPLYAAYDEESASEKRDHDEI